MVFRYAPATDSSFPNSSSSSFSASRYKCLWVSIPPTAFFVFRSRARWRWDIFCVSINGWACTRHLIMSEGGLPAKRGSSSLGSDQGKIDFSSPPFTGLGSGLVSLWQSFRTQETFNCSFGSFFPLSDVWVHYTGTWDDLDCKASTGRFCILEPSVSPFYIFKVA